MFAFGLFDQIVARNHIFAYAARFPQGIRKQKGVGRRSFYRCAVWAWVTLPLDPTDWARAIRSSAALI